MQNYLKITRSFGIDEVGRGPLAGPVVAACVYFPDNVIVPEYLPQIRDSKKMTHNNRVKIIHWLDQQDDIRYAIGSASVEEIDEINILQATMLAMERAFYNLSNDQKCVVLVDGNRKPNIADKQIECIIKGDDNFMSIALASIVAKEYRDNIMKEIDISYPQYGFAKNVGYGTKQHIEAIHKYGPTVHHRKSFAPISSIVTKK